MSEEVSQSSFGSVKISPAGMDEVRLSPARVPFLASSALFSAKPWRATQQTAPADTAHSLPCCGRLGPRDSSPLLILSSPSHPPTSHVFYVSPPTRSLTNRQPHAAATSQGLTPVSPQEMPPTTWIRASATRLFSFPCPRCAYSAGPNHHAHAKCAVGRASARGQYQHLLPQQRLPSLSWSPMLVSASHQRHDRLE